METNFFFVSGDGWEFIPGKDLDDFSKLLCSWGTPESGAFFYLFSLSALNFPNGRDIDVNIFIFAASTCPRLKKRYHTRVERIKEYLEMVKDFDELISPQSLFLHFLGPESSNHVRKNVEIVKNSEFTKLSFSEVGLICVYLHFSFSFFFCFCFSYFFFLNDD